MPGVSEGANFWHLGEEIADRGSSQSKDPQKVAYLAYLRTSKEDIELEQRE